MDDGDRTICVKATVYICNSFFEWFRLPTNVMIRNCYECMKGKLGIKEATFGNHHWHCCWLARCKWKINFVNGFWYMIANNLLTLSFIGKLSPQWFATRSQFLLYESKIDWIYLKIDFIFFEQIPWKITREIRHFAEVFTNGS